MESYDVSFEMAHRLQQQGLYEQAIAGYGKTLQIRPNDIMSLINRGICFRELNKYKESIEDLTNAKCFCKVPAVKAMIYYFRGGVYSRAGNYDLSEADYSQSLKTDFYALDILSKLTGEETDIFAERASVYVKLGNFSKAIKDYNNSIAKSPKVTTFHDRGKCYLWVNNFELALSDFSSAIKMGVDGLGLADTLFSRGAVYRQLKMYDEAIADYNKAIELNPPFISQVYNNRGNVYYLIENYEMAKSDYDYAIKLDPEYTDAYLSRSQVNKLLGNESESVNDLNEGKRLAIKHQEDEKFVGSGVVYKKYDGLSL
jgi:tetratricopeptide (TPR) repeat protein